MKAKNNTYRKLILAALVVVVGYGLFFLPRSEGQAFPADPEEALRERFDAYVDLRMQDDWVALYDMVDPEQRDAVDQSRFLRAYGTKALKTHGIGWVDAEVNAEARTALVKVATDAEMRIENLPPQYRAGFRAPDDPSELRRTTEQYIQWVWRDGDWYYRLDQEVIGGIDPKNGVARR